MLSYLVYCFVYFFFFFNDTATTEIYTLSLHDALPISLTRRNRFVLRLLLALAIAASSLTNLALHSNPTGPRMASILGRASLQIKQSWSVAFRGPVLLWIPENGGSRSTGKNGIRKT